jgi:predicted transcriptional regulator
VTTPDFKAYLLGGPKVDDFSIDRDRDATRVLEASSGSFPLDGETIAAIEEGLAQAGRGEFASDAEIEALWKQLGRSSREPHGER